MEYQTDIVAGRRLRLLRENKGLELQECADVLGIRIRALMSYEGGHSVITPNHLYQIALLFEIAGEELYTVSGLNVPEDEENKVALRAAHGIKERQSVFSDTESAKPAFNVISADHFSDPKIVTVDFVGKKVVRNPNDINGPNSRSPS